MKRLLPTTGRILRIKSSPSQGQPITSYPCRKGKCMRTRLISLSALLLIVPVVSFAQTASDADLSARLAELEKAIEAKRLDTHAPGVALVVLKDDRVLYM